MGLRRFGYAAPFVMAAFACSGAGSHRATSAVDAAVDSGASGPADDSGVDTGASIAEDGAAPDATVPLPADADAGDAGLDADDGSWCEWGGAPGDCMTTTACAAIADHTSYANECPGPASIECCIVTPSTADNPPFPAGYVLMQQAQVTTAMTNWAVVILNAPLTYPMFSTTTMTFGTQLVLARVEWHPPDFQNSVIHRGVTLYEPAD